MSLDFIDTSIHPIYGYHEDMVTTVLCPCWKGAQVLLVPVPKAHLESAPKLVPHLLPRKLQHEHDGAQTSPSPPSKVIFVLQEPCKVSVPRALTAEAVRLPARQQTQWYKVSPLGSPPPATPMSSGLFSWAQGRSSLT